jgi:NitT/TauT family transport system substrate-binding protein
MQLGRRALTTFVLAAGVARPALAQKRKLRVGILRLASSGGVFIALARGYFQDAGLDVELTYFDAAQPIAVAAASGDIDIGVTAFTTGLFNLAGKGAISVVAGQSREVRGFPLIAYLASTHAPGAASIHAPKDLAGHRVGVTQTGSTFHYSLGLLAEKYGFPLSSVQIVALQSLSNVAAAVKGGAVDGALLPVTTAKPLLDGGDARLLGWVGDETPWQLGCVFVSRRMKQEPDVIAQFLVAYRRGCRDYHDVLLAAAKDGAVPVTDATKPLLDIIAKEVGQSVDQVRVGLPYVDPEAKLDVANVANQIAWNQQQGFIDKGFTIDSVIDPAFVKP